MRRLVVSGATFVLGLVLGVLGHRFATRSPPRAVIATPSGKPKVAPPSAPSAQLVDSSSWEAAANKGLTTLKALASERPTTIGIAPGINVSDLGLGGAWPLEHLGALQLRQLAKLEPVVGPPPTPLARPEQRAYPITRNGQIESSLVIARIANQYRPVAYGERLLTEALRQATTFTMPGGITPTLVEVPALHLYMVRVDKRYVPIRPSGPFTPGTPVDDVPGYFKSLAQGLPADLNKGPI